MGRFTTITVDHVLARIKMQLRISDTSNDDYFQVLIFEAVRHIDALSIFVKKQAKLCIVDGKAQLPCDFYRLLAMRGKSNGICGTQVYIDRNFLNDCGCEVTNSLTTTTTAVIDGVPVIQSFSPTFQFNNNIMYVGSNNDADEFEMAYMGLNQDKHGTFLIYEDFERALMSYACYMYCLSDNTGMYNQYQIEDYKRTWINQKEWLKGIAFANDFQNNKYKIKEILTAIALAPQAYQIWTDL